MEATTKPKWRYGKFRWIVLGLIILQIIGARVFPPVRPEIILPAEALTEHPLFSLPVLGDFYLTNTMVAMILVDLVILLIALMVRKQYSSGKKVPNGFVLTLEALVEYIYNMTESTAGKKWAKQIFPWFFTITLFVLVANWMELIPGVDSIGFLHHSEEGHPVSQVLGLTTLEQGEAAPGEGFAVVPFVRVLTTDLNFTVALAVIVMVMVQYFGFKAQGFRYLEKFWNVKTIFNKPMLGLIDWGVGILEIISELSKILSFSFRLFGNIFAGSVMLFVIGSLLPVVAQSAFLGLEFFVGAIQAVVFGMLAMVFMSMALHGHGDAEKHQEHEA
ncbi:MAG: F0F1 ATP synthase subunit A [Chloroflexi bacterium]|nr:F0F1 ATP synthase subunit A [Chloroflexota bacterium]